MHHAPTGTGRHGRDAAEQLDAVSPPERGIAGREVPAKIAQARAPQQGIHDSVGKHIRIGMAGQAAWPRNLHSADPQQPSQCQPVCVVADPGPDDLPLSGVRLGQVEIGGHRDLQIPGGVFDHAHGVPEALDQHRVIGPVKPFSLGPVVRLPEQRGAECLRGVRDPQPVAVERLSGVGSVDQLDRLPHRESGRGRAGFRGRLDHGRHHVRWHQGSGAVMYDRDRRLPEVGEPRKHRVLPVRAPRDDGRHVAHAVLHQQHARPVDVGGTDDHDDAADLWRQRDPPCCMQEHGNPGDRHKRLGDGGAQALAAARRDDHGGRLGGRHHRRSEGAP